MQASLRHRLKAVFLALAIASAATAAPPLPAGDALWDGPAEAARRDKARAGLDPPLSFRGGPAMLDPSDVLDPRFRDTAKTLPEPEWTPFDPGAADPGQALLEIARAGKLASRGSGDAPPDPAQAAAKEAAKDSAQDTGRSVQKGYGMTGPGTAGTDHGRPPGFSPAF